MEDLKAKNLSMPRDNTFWDLRFLPSQCNDIGTSEGKSSHFLSEFY